jgi:hypothetical protein
LVFVYVVAPPLFVGLVVDCAVTRYLRLFCVRAVAARTDCVVSVVDVWYSWLQLLIVVGRTD